MKGKKINQPKFPPPIKEKCTGKATSLLFTLKLEWCIPACCCAAAAGGWTGGGTLAAARTPRRCSPTGGAPR